MCCATFANTEIAAKLGVEGSGSQILPVIIGDNGRAVRIAARMRADGFDIRAIRPPTVPEGTARLRIAHHAQRRYADDFAHVHPAGGDYGGGKAMMRFVVTGTDTGIGKTVFSAALAAALDGFYWKPVQSGLDEETDSQVVCRLSRLPPGRILPEAYKLQTAASPHLAARLDNVEIVPESLTPPVTDAPLVIEGAGGLLVPLTERTSVRRYLCALAHPGYPLRPHGARHDQSHAAVTRSAAQPLHPGLRHRLHRRRGDRNAADHRRNGERAGSRSAAAA